MRTHAISILPAECLATDECHIKLNRDIAQTCHRHASMHTHKPHPPTCPKPQKMREKAAQQLKPLHVGNIPVLSKPHSTADTTMLGAALAERHACIFATALLGVVAHKGLWSGQYTAVWATLSSSDSTREGSNIMHDHYELCTMLRLTAFNDKCQGKAGVGSALRHMCCV